MGQEHFEMQWPRENLFLSGFVHEIMNYRYHWHTSDYELNILLHGSQEFCRGNQSYLLEEDDVLLVSPGVGHASYAQQANTRALVLHFSPSAFKQFVKKGYTYQFPSCCSTKENRHESAYEQIRFYAGQIYACAQKDTPYSQLAAKGSFELLLSALCTLFSPETVQIPDQEDRTHQETVQRLINYIEQHYQEKISLEDLAQFSQYNRTYISTLFKNTVGVNFYEYLTRVRFQHALIDLSGTEKTLTSIALDNGFSDLKSFNARFKETLHRSPAAYRAQLSPDRIMPADIRRYISPEDKLLQKKLQEYLKLPN